MKFWQFVKADDAKKAIENTITYYERKIASLNEELEREKARADTMESIAFDLDMTLEQRKGLSICFNCAKSFASFSPWHIHEATKNMVKGMQDFLEMEAAKAIIEVKKIAKRD